MAKTKTIFFCTNCGNETPRWMGRCPGCGAYNTMEEHIEKPAAPGRAVSAPVGISRKPQRIREVRAWQRPCRPLLPGIWIRSDPGRRK